MWSLTLMNAMWTDVLIHHSYVLCSLIHSLYMSSNPLNDRLSDMTPTCQAPTQPHFQRGGVSTSPLGINTLSASETSPVMLSPRGQSGPRGQNFGLGLKDLASASKLWPRCRCLTTVCDRAFFGQKSCKIPEFCSYFSGNNLKSYVVNHYLVLF